MGLTRRLNKHVSIAPLVHYRILFGLLMLASTLRFWWNGWIGDFYIEPDFHFTYYGFDWVKPLGDPGMYILFGLMALTSLNIMLGFLYRISTIVFFLAFTYVELIDKTFYLNHYYFVSIIAFILMLLPANGKTSLDVKFGLRKKIDTIPAWIIFAIITQVSIVYFYAGVAKINADWLIEAEPLKTWLKPKYDTPLIGELLRYNETAYVFSWFGMIFDCMIPFFMLWKRTRLAAYGVLIIFHALTALLFPIGVFPYVMMLGALIYFPPIQHERILNWWTGLFGNEQKSILSSNQTPDRWKWVKGILITHLIIQIVVPWRYLLYPGDLFWNEEGFRFSWRVMLVEKEGEAFFYVKHPDYPGYKPIDHTKHLIPQQIKQMSFQPDMLIQYAHHLKKEFTGKVYIEGKDTIVLDDPQIHAEVYVKMNGTSSQLMIDKDVVLSDMPYDLSHREFITRFEK